jgi:hypothetical protein
MEKLLPAYKAVGERRYRETNGLYWEDFETTRHPCETKLSYEISLFNAIKH